MNETNWIPGLVVLGVALVAGVAMAVRAKKGPKIPGLAAGTGVDLARQRDALYQEIRELDAGRSTMADSDWRAERLRLELEAARTLQAMDRPQAPTAPEAPRAQTWADRNPRLVNLAWGVGSGLFVAAVVISVQQMATPKPENAGGPMGGGPMAGGGAPGAEGQAIDPALAAALETARTTADAQPENDDAQLLYARLLLDAGDLMESFKVARRVTDRDPTNPTARTYQAAVLIQVGDLPTAGKALDKVLATHPDHLEALAYRGLVHMLLGEREGAIEKWERVVALDPSKASEFSPLLAAARDPNFRPPGGGAPSGGAPSGAAPTSGAAGAHADDPADVVGRIELGGGVAAVPAGQTLFLFARPTGADRGPPAAARRLPTDTFPLDFRIGPNDSPMGGPFPAEMTLTARIDADGNPNTKGPDDLEGRVEGVKPGTTGVVLTLARVGP